MHNSESIISFASTILNLFGVFKSLSYTQDLEGVALLTQALEKLPPNLNESWALHAVKRSLYQPSLLHLNDRLAEKAEAQDRMRANSPKNRNPENQTNAGPKTLSSNSKVSDKKPYQQCPPCAVCNGKYAIWSSSVYKEKNFTQSAKFVTKQKWCFSCLQSDHTFRKCPNSRKCNKLDCNNTHNALLHGTERKYPAKDSTKSPAEVKTFWHSASPELEIV